MIMMLAQSVVRIATFSSTTMGEKTFADKAGAIPVPATAPTPSTRRRVTVKRLLTVSAIGIAVHLLLHSPSASFFARDHKKGKPLTGKAAEKVFLYVSNYLIQFSLDMAYAGQSQMRRPARRHRDTTLQSLTRLARRMIYQPQWTFFTFFKPNWVSRRRQWIPSSLPDRPSRRERRCLFHIRTRLKRGLTSIIR